ncbi:hypothetical protein B0H17DRAFT_1152123 [Mycena rosella]|uniref:Uncharacterized protein n=1 Tax=Mycena rosella TaxID=1033263 RepID=A0AAD7BG33_MYCRO|nr:hypothetical protein B0H17DRAFT_1152123 [Mycena rosella]
MSPGILSIAQLLNPEEENLDARQEIAALRQIPGAVPEGQQALVLPADILNRETTLERLFRHPRGATVEYPETSSSGTCLPWKDFQYSHGLPGGAAMNGSFKYTQLLVNSRGEPVRCQIQHKTCLGVKACTRSKNPLVELNRSAKNSTVAGSEAPLCPGPFRQRTMRRSHNLSRGQRRREQRKSTGLSHHWADFNIDQAQYDIDYIAAVFTGDTQALARIEEPAAEENHGPLAPSIVHRLPDSKLQLLEMVPVTCAVKYRIWYPIEEDRADCPYALVTSEGEHTHPIPLPEKTPMAVRRDILMLLKNLREELPDITPRRFLRHPAVKNFLNMKFPNNPFPTLSDLHPSLANRSHIASYISRAIKEDFPEGTDWKGTEAIRLHQAPVVMRLLAVQRLKAEQDANLPEEEHYIRVILELDNNNLPVHEEDDEPGEPGEKTRIIICMSREGSRRLQLYGAYLQSDTGFKRIVGFDEFELAAMDRDANTSIIFCRVYITRHTAAAHQHIFEELERIVLTDTGSELRWRHLHATTQDETAALILHWTADQHRGQAKGLGLHLVAVAQKLPADRMDLYETDRPLRSLGPYDHLRRLFRLCVVHYCRNIKTCAVKEPVRQLMRGLACIQHPDWDVTVNRIRNEGGKAGEAHSNLTETVHRDVNREGVHCTLLGVLLKGQQFDALKMRTLKLWETVGIRPTNQPTTSVVNALKNLKRQDQLKINRARAMEARVAKHNDLMQKCHDALEKALQDLRRIGDDAHQRRTAAIRLWDVRLAGARIAAKTALSRYSEQRQIGEDLHRSHASGVARAAAVGEDILD